MNKLKISAILIVGLFVGMSTATAVTMTGKIQNNVETYVGLVYPTILIENQTVNLNVEIEGTGDNMSYFVNDTLVIPVNNSAAGSADHKYLLPRSAYYGIFVTRKLTEVLRTILDGSGIKLKEKLLPAMAIGGIKVVDSLLGEADDHINVSLQYHITQDQFLEGENLTMYVYMMGFLPGEVNGLIGEGFPLVAHSKITLGVEYHPTLY